MLFAPPGARRATYLPAEDPAEMGLVGKSAGSGDLADRLHAIHQHVARRGKPEREYVGVRRQSETALERPGKIAGAQSGGARHVIDGDGLVKVGSHMLDDTPHLPWRI